MSSDKLAFGYITIIIAIPMAGNPERKGCTPLASSLFVFR